MALPPEIMALLAQYDAADADVHALLNVVDEQTGTWIPSPDQWSIAHCLDHLATTNREYLGALEAAASASRTAPGRSRRGPAIPGFFGKMFIRSLEPPVPKMMRIKTSKKIVPRPDVSLAEAAAQFFASQKTVRDFVAAYADLDLASIRFANPFIPGLRFSVASGLYIIAAHERRHLWQARQVRNLAEQARATAAG